ncbi:hypothetical protein BY996DRAFT_6415753 [Phakopsora pachyrhizi]|nr:hypothetical protein BY996DRAFT_6415753 [Phakopsora pachyrhizi]
MRQESVCISSLQTPKNSLRTFYNPPTLTSTTLPDLTDTTSTLLDLYQPTDRASTQPPQRSLIDLRTIEPSQIASHLHKPTEPSSPSPSPSPSPSSAGVTGSLRYSHNPSNLSTSSPPSSGNLHSISHKVNNLQNLPPWDRPLEHDMDRAIGLFGPPIKPYYQGLISRRTILHSDGNPPKRIDQSTQWTRNYVQVTGNTMSSWDAAELDLAASQGHHVSPSYTNITDARVYLLSDLDPSSLDPPHPHVFYLNNAGRNKLAFACPDQNSLISIVSAIRLATWERSRLFEIYTGTLLGLRVPQSSDLPPIKEITEGWLTVRFPGDTEWVRVWCTITDKNHMHSGGSGGGRSSVSAQGHRESLWNRRASLFNLAGFGNRSSSQPDHHTGPSPPSDLESEPTLVFHSKKGNKRSILGSMTALTLAAAVYPESRALIEASTIFKLEGTFKRLNPDDSSDQHHIQSHSQLGPEGFILATPGEGNSLNDMLAWLLGIMGAFNLYGRPNQLNYDPSDPSSLYFAYPLDPARLFLDCQVARQLDVNQNSLRQIRLGFISLVAQAAHYGLKPEGPADSSADHSLPQSPSRHQQQVGEGTPQIFSSASPGNSAHQALGYDNHSFADKGLLDQLAHPSALSAQDGLDVAIPPTSSNRSFVSKEAYLDGPVANDENLKKSGNSSPVAKPLATVTSPAPSSLQSSQASIPISSVEKLPRSPLGHKVQDTESTSSDLRAKVRDSDEDQEGVEDMLFALSLAYGETPNSETEEKPIERKELSTSNSVLPRSPSSLTPIPSKLSDEDSKIEILATPAAPPKTSFPSTFAAGKKSAARLAAAQAAQAADKAAIGTQPIRNTILYQGNTTNSMMIPGGNFSHASQQFLTPQHALDSYQHQQHQGSRVVSQYGNRSEMGQFPSSSSRREIPAVLREQPTIEVTDPTAVAGLRPAISEHGLLHRVMQERQEKSAKSIQEAAHFSGEPLLQVSAKPPPPQTGLLGAIASHERDRKREGGMGAALTERARERAVRQREDEMIQRQSMMFNPMGGQMMMPGGNGMMPMMYNPAMMGLPNQNVMVPNLAYEQMMFQQHQMQMQMLAAQQAYMNSFGGYPISGSAGNVGMIGGVGGHQSMYGAPSGISTGQMIHTLPQQQQSSTGLPGTQLSMSGRPQSNNNLPGVNPNLAGNQNQYTSHHPY